MTFAKPRPLALDVDFYCVESYHYLARVVEWRFSNDCLLLGSVNSLNINQPQGR